MERSYWVYILASDKGNLYIGVTNNLVRRIYEHKNDLVDGYSKQHQCHKLIYFEVTSEIEVAIQREKQLKGWSRKKKRLLIATQNSGWRDLSLDFKLNAL